MVVMSEFSPAELGRSVSHGTLRTGDLLVMFLPLLLRVSPSDHSQIGDDPTDRDVLAALRITGDFDFAQGTTARERATVLDHADELLAWVVDRIDGAAPDGYRFGPHEGDGSDFGFWPVDQVNEDQDSRPAVVGGDGVVDHDRG